MIVDKLLGTSRRDGQTVNIKLVDEILGTSRRDG